MKVTTLRLGCISLFALAIAHPLSAAEDPFYLAQKGDEANAALYKYDTAVPVAPALALVKGAPELTVTSPFGPDLSKEIILSGEKPGAALAVKPYWYFGGAKGKTLGGYRHPDRRLERVFARTTISFAAAPHEEGGTTGLGIGAGLHTELLDEADPRFNKALAICLGANNITRSENDNSALEKAASDAVFMAQARAEAVKQLSEGTSADRANAFAVSIQTAGHLGIVTEMDRVDPKAAAGFDAWYKKAAQTKFAADDAKINEPCFKRAALAAQNSSSFQAGVGYLATSATYSFSGLKSAGNSAWLAYRLPLGIYRDCKDPDQLSVSLEAPKDGEEAKGPICLPPQGNISLFYNFTGDGSVKVAGAAQDAEVQQGGVVLSRQSPDNKWSIAASAVIESRDFKNPLILKESFERYGLSGSFKLRDGVWIELAYGETNGRAGAEESYSFVRLNFK